MVWNTGGKVCADDFCQLEYTVCGTKMLPKLDSYSIAGVFTYVKIVLYLRVR